MNCYRDRYRGWRPGTNCVSGGLYVSFKSIEIRCRYFLRSINLIYISFFFFFFYLVVEHFGRNSGLNIFK